jgi:hypothetical protein
VSQPDSRTTIPIFPLSTVVIFPGADCPLHIFEPRYRQMTREARAGAGLIGMVTVRPEHAGELAGDPAVFPIGCAGRIVRCEELPDGRFNVVLRGLWRFRIAAEPGRPAERLYRSALVDPLPEATADPERVRGLRERVGQAFGRLVALVAPERAKELGPRLVAGVDDAGFVSALVQILNLPTLERQSLLEANGVGARLEALEAILRFQLAGLGLAEGSGPGRMH